MKVTKDSWWVIYVGGYGSFLHQGTTKNAEEMRRHKSQWEGGVGWKFLCGTKEKAELVIRHARNLESPISKREFESIITEVV